MNQLRLALIVLLGVAVSAAGSSSHASSLRNPEYSSQHPTVRDLLRERLIRARSFTSNSGRRSFSGNPLMLEQWVDRAAVDLFEKLDRELTRMNESFSAAYLAWQQLCDEGFQDAALQQSWKKSLHRLAESAKNLKGAVDDVVPRIKGARGFLDWGAAEGGSRPYSEEMSRLEELVKESERQIERYFFTAGQAVRVDELRGPDMVKHLELVQDLADQLARGH